MSAELWRSEIALYGFMILNVLAVATGLLWAARRGHLRDLDDTMMKGLQLSDDARPKENGNG
jgi:hypothetical protein